MKARMSAGDRHVDLEADSSEGVTLIDLCAATLNLWEATALAGPALDEPAPVGMGFSTHMAAAEIAADRDATSTAWQPLRRPE